MMCVQSAPEMVTNARALHFVRGGREVFIKSVTHPPMTRAMGWWSSNEPENEDWIREELRAELNKAMEEVK